MVLFACGGGSGHFSHRNHYVASVLNENGFERALEILSSETTKTHHCAWGLHLFEEEDSLEQVSELSTLWFTK